jgi:hypothetical protein
MPSLVSDSSDSEVSNEENNMTQLDWLTFPTNYLDLQRKASEKYKEAMQNVDFRTYRTTIVERDQMAGALVRARIMSSTPGISRESIAEFMNEYTEEEFTKRRNEMMTKDILPNTSFWDLSEDKNMYIIEDGLGGYSYNVRAFRTREEQTIYLNDVHRRHASIFPIPEEDQEVAR